MSKRKNKQQVLWTVLKGTFKETRVKNENKGPWFQNINSNKNVVVTKSNRVRETTMKNKYRTIF